jgi:hypothetical protein
LAGATQAHLEQDVRATNLLAGVNSTTSLAIKDDVSGKGAAP